MAKLVAILTDKHWLIVGRAPCWSRDGMNHMTARVFVCVCVCVRVCVYVSLTHLFTHPPTHPLIRLLCTRNFTGTDNHKSQQTKNLWTIH